MGDQRTGRRHQIAAAAAGLPAGAGDAGRRLQCLAAGAAWLQPAARCAVCPRRPVCGAPACVPHLRPHAPAVAALSSGAAHRRPVAHHRARHQGHRDDRPLHHAEHGADHPRIRADHRHLRLHLWLEICGRRRRHRLALCLVHGQGQRLAHLDPPRHERQRHRRQHQGDRLACSITRRSNISTTKAWRPSASTARWRATRSPRPASGPRSAG